MRAFGSIGWWTVFGVSSLAAVAGCSAAASGQIGDTSGPACQFTTRDTSDCRSHSRFRSGHDLLANGSWLRSDSRAGRDY